MGAIDGQNYLMATHQVLTNNLGMARTWRGETKYRHTFIGRPILGAQCLTVTAQVPHKHLGKVIGLGDEMAYMANAQSARVYRDQQYVRVEYALPPDQWRDVPLSGLPHKKGRVTLGLKALGRPAIMEWDGAPHKLMFGSTRTGKTTCIADIIIGLARTHDPAELKIVVINPKNDPTLHPFERLAHLAAPAANDYEPAAARLRFVLGEMERRRTDHSRAAQRWVVIIDEVAQLIMIRPEVTDMIIQLSQLAGGLNINLIVASQAANATVFGERGSLAKANFRNRVVFRLPHDQAYYATGLRDQHPELLCGKGDALGISDVVTRFRAALPSESDYAGLPLAVAAPDEPAAEQLAGDAAIDNWPAPVDQMAYALACARLNGRFPGAGPIQRRFNVGTDKARLARDVALELWERINLFEKELAGGLE